MIKIDTQKKQIYEAAIMYYEQKMTQQQIADILKLSRQTVSKLLNEAINTGVVKISVNQPQETCKALEQKLCDLFKIREAVVCGISEENNTLRYLMTVEKSVKYLLPILNQQNKKIAISWGRTIESLIQALPNIKTFGNTVFPLFGATQSVDSFFLSNELAYKLANKIDAEIKYAWFPYCPEVPEDVELIKQTSCYKNIVQYWKNIDIAIVGIGNNSALTLYEKSFDRYQKNSRIIGDISTHFFTIDGTVIPHSKDTLCATKEDLLNSKMTIAIACGDDKSKAIIGALKTGIIDVMILDEFTAKTIIKYSSNPEY